MVPRVLYHVAASVDARVDHIQPDLGQFYGLAAGWGEDCILTGADTILAAMPADAMPDEVTAAAPQPDVEGAAQDGGQAAGRKPLLAVVDSRARVRSWRALKALTDYWRDPVALVSAATEPAYVRLVEETGCRTLATGERRVDLGEALAALAERFGVRRVRVDSGGALAGALLRAGLVDEVSVLLQPALVGGVEPRTFYRAPELHDDGGVLSLRLVDATALEGDVVWLRYETSR